MQVCLFDIDGTLIDTGGAGRDAMVVALAREFKTAPACDGVVFAGRTDRAIASDLFRLHSIDDTDANWNRFRETFVQEMPERLRLRQGTSCLVSPSCWTTWRHASTWCWDC